MRKKVKKWSVVNVANVEVILNREIIEHKIFNKCISFPPDVNIPQMLN